MDLDDWTYGDVPNTPVVTGNRGILVRFAYKVLGDPDENYTDDIPTDAGEYTVRAVASSPDYYGTAAATDDFRIRKRTPVLGEDFDIVANSVTFDGTYQPLVTILIRGGTTLKIWCSFDQRNTLAGTPKKRDAGSYDIWYKVNGDKNYEELADWNGPVRAIVRFPLTVTADSAAKFFDGEPLACTGCKAELPTGEYEMSDIVYSGSITEPGEQAAAVSSLKILDADGNDVTESFDITFVPGRLVVLDGADFTVPSGLREIGEEAFSGAAAESVELGASVTQVGANAFRGCEALKALIVHGTETGIEDTALAGCEAVTVFAPFQSTARTFAEKNNIPFVPLADPGE